MVRSRIGLVCGATALLMALSVTAFAQGGRQGRGGGMMAGGLRLLAVKEVQEELKMTQPQIDKIEGKQQEVMASMQEVFQGAGGGGGFQNLSPEERQKLMAKVQEVQTKAVNDILDATQQKRFRQLELQQGGLNMAVARKDVADQLKITDEQRQKIGEIQRGLMEEMQSLRQGGGGGQDATPEERQKMNTKRAEIQKAANDKALALLTDTQKKTWTELTGAPFKFPPMGFGGPRPRP
jgi:hypothetical protein